MKPEQRITAIQKLLAQGGPDVFREIAAYLEGDDREVRITAIGALGELPVSEKIKFALLPLTEDLDEEIRYLALEALWGYTGEDVFKAHIDRLKDGDELVRISAIEGLGELRDARAEKYLVDSLIDEEEIVRRDAAEGLGKIGAVSAISTLQNHLQQETSSLAKVGFYTGLYLLGSKMHLKSLLNLLKDPSYVVRCAVANSAAVLADHENEKGIKKALQAALRREPTIAAQSTFQRVLDELSS
ncbi:HEAT repeat domain-containing protein [Planococcus sp. ISL-110]|uniref:HEAT repeat domain-containing protein n=1 Tax=Planococcus sp. ISL-110 TaxID=2819167 RepID=UPI001BE7A6F7|nr:HEAT repeat domain-containing protein [Planococcus sp. ISL-110]MBT2570749.1 HEAT repeat domain-containing protein [Planococcus sp. ISL-110]